MKTLTASLKLLALSALGITGVCVALGLAPLWSIGVAGVAVGLAVAATSEAE